MLSSSCISLFWRILGLSINFMLLLWKNIYVFLMFCLSSVEEGGCTEYQAVIKVTNQWLVCEFTVRCSSFLSSLIFFETTCTHFCRPGRSNRRTDCNSFYQTTALQRFCFVLFVQILQYSWAVIVLDLAFEKKIKKCINWLMHTHWSWLTTDWSYHFG